MCQRDNNPTIKKTTAEGHQQVFNAARNFRTEGVLQLAPKQILVYTSLVIMNAILNFKYTQETKIKNNTRLTKARVSRLEKGESVHW